MDMLSPRWSKVLKDLWGSKARTLLAVLAIAAGVFAVGMVSTAYLLIDHDINTTYLAIHPAHGVISTEPFDDTLVKFVEQQPDVEEAEGRVILKKMNILLESDKKHPLVIMAVDDLSALRMDQLTLLEGEWPDRLEILVIPSRFAQAGDLMEVELPDGRIRTLRVSGVVEDLNSLAVGAELELLAYVNLETLDALGLPRTFNRLYFRVPGDAPTEAGVQAAARNIERLFFRSDTMVVQSSVRSPNQHPVAPVAKGLLGALAVISMLLVILGGFLVINTISALLARQVRQVGVMKAVGARAGQIMSIYLTLAISYGAMALLLAAPLGPWAGFALAQSLASILNFSLLGFRIFPASLLLMLAVGLLIPCLSALFPVLSAMRITVREAIATYGTGIGFGRRPIDRLIERFRGLPRPLLLCLRNVVRRRGRLGLTLSTLALAGAIFMSVFTTRASVIRSFRPMMRLIFADLNLDFEHAYHTEMIVQSIQQTPGVVHVEGWAVTIGELLEADGQTVADRFTIHAPPIGSPMTTHPPVVKGRWLAEGDQNALVIATEISRRHPIQVGDTIHLRINGRSAPFVIVGEYQDMPGEDGKRAFASYSYISRLLDEPGRARSYRVLFESSEPAYQDRVSTMILDTLKPRSDTPSFFTGASAWGAIYSGADAIAGLLMVVAVLIVAVGGIGLASTMSMNVLERTREIGVMRAIGSSSRRIRQMVIVEGVLVGLLSWVIALGLSLPLSRLLCNVVGLALLSRPLDYIFNWSGVVIWLGLIVVISALASLWPAINAARLTVRDALAYE